MIVLHPFPMAVKGRFLGTIRVSRTVELAVAVGALVAWLMLAAVAGVASAGPLEDAASAHERGDDATAVQLLRPLAEEGNAFAQFALGFIYDTAEGIPQDDAEAAKWYRKAADQGVAGAQYNLGAMYADGHGVPLDYVEAYKWLSVAVSRFPVENRDVAVRMRDLLAAKMTPTQVAEAQKLPANGSPSDEQIVGTTGSAPMVSWLTEIFDPAARLGHYAVLATLLFVATLLISFAVALIILIRLPSDYFCTPRTGNARHAGHGLFFSVGIVLKNLLGVVLIIIGVILSVPGLPRQGLLTVLAGLFLLDFPGKRNLLYKLVSRPLLLQAINRLRMKFSQPPLVVG